VRRGKEVGLDSRINAADGPSDRVRRATHRCPARGHCRNWAETMSGEGLLGGDKLTLEPLRLHGGDGCAIVSVAIKGKSPAELTSAESIPQSVSQRTMAACRRRRLPLVSRRATLLNHRLLALASGSDDKAFGRAVPSRGSLIPLVVSSWNKELFSKPLLDAKSPPGATHQSSRYITQSRSGDRMPRGFQSCRSDPGFFPVRRAPRAFALGHASPRNMFADEDRAN